MPRTEWCVAVTDLRRINSQAVYAKNSGVIILGGGLIKHHICNANLMVSTDSSSCVRYDLVNNLQVLENGPANWQYNLAHKLKRTENVLMGNEVRETETILVVVVIVVVFVIVFEFYIVVHKKTWHFTLVHIFTNYWPIFKIFLLWHFADNLQ